MREGVIRLQEEGKEEEGKEEEQQHEGRARGREEEEFIKNCTRARRDSQRDGTNALSRAS